MDDGKMQMRKRAKKLSAGSNMTRRFAFGGKTEKEREKGNYLVYATVCSLASVSSAAGAKARL